MVVVAIEPSGLQAHQRPGSFLGSLRVLLLKLLRRRRRMELLILLLLLRLPELLAVVPPWPCCGRCVEELPELLPDPLLLSGVLAPRVLRQAVVEPLLQTSARLRPRLRVVAGRVDVEKRDVAVGREVDLVERRGRDAQLVKNGAACRSASTASTACPVRPIAAQSAEAA